MKTKLAQACWLCMRSSLVVGLLASSFGPCVTCESYWDSEWCHCVARASHVHISGVELPADNGGKDLKLPQQHHDSGVAKKRSEWPRLQRNGPHCPPPWNWAGMGRPAQRATRWGSPAAFRHPSHSLRHATARPACPDGATGVDLRRRSAKRLGLALAAACIGIRGNRPPTNDRQTTCLWPSPTARRRPRSSGSRRRAPWNAAAGPSPDCRGPRPHARIAGAATP